MSIIIQIWDSFYVTSLQVLTEKKQNTKRIYQGVHGSQFRNYSGIFWTLCKLWHIQNSGIFIILAYSKPEAYSEPCYIQNSGTFRTRDIFRTLSYSELEAYSEPCQKSTMECFQKQLTAMIIFANHNYFRGISFSHPLVHETNTIFLMQVYFLLQKP